MSSDQRSPTTLAAIETGQYSTPSMPGKRCRSPSAMSPEPTPAPGSGPASPGGNRLVPADAPMSAERGLG